MRGSTFHSPNCNVFMPGEDGLADYCMWLDKSREGEDYYCNVCAATVEQIALVCVDMCREQVGERLFCECWPVKQLSETMSLTKMDEMATADSPGTQRRKHKQPSPSSVLSVR